MQMGFVFTNQISPVGLISLIVLLGLTIQIRNLNKQVQKHSRILYVDEKSGKHCAPKKNIRLKRFLGMRTL